MLKTSLVSDALLTVWAGAKFARGYPYACAGSSYCTLYWLAVNPRPAGYGLMRRTQRHPCGLPSRRKRRALKLNNKSLDRSMMFLLCSLDRNAERPCPLPSYTPRPRAEMASSQP